MMKVGFRTKFFLILVAALCLVPAMAMAQGFTIDFRNATGFGIQNPDEFQIDGILVEFAMEHPLFPGEMLVTTIPADIIWKFNYAELDLKIAGIPSHSGCTSTSSLTLTVSNSLVRDTPIEGAAVTIGDQSLATDALGKVTFSAIEAGNVQVEISHPDFAPFEQSYEIACGENIDRGVALMPVNDTGTLRGDMRLILTWGAEPMDLDSHLTRYQSATTDPDFHVYYSNPSPTGVPAWLDVDDTTSFGPETITIQSPFEPGLYRYSVHHYSGDANIVTSGTTVELWQGDQLIRTFTPPADVQGVVGYNWVWTVLEIIVSPDGSVSFNDHIGTPFYGPTGASSVRSARADRLGAPAKMENPALFLNLPAKQ